MTNQRPIQTTCGGPSAQWSSQAVLEALPCQAALVDASGKVVAVNLAWREFVEADSQAPLRGQVGEPCGWRPEESSANTVIEQAAQGLRQVLTSQAIEYCLEYPCPLPGQPRWLAARVTPLEGEGEGDEDRGALVTHTDVTESVLARLKAERLSRLYGVLCRIDAAIVCPQSPLELYDAACRIIVEEGQLSMALVAEVTAGEPPVAVVASAGDFGGYSERLSVTIDATSRSQGTIGTALRSGAFDVCNDFANDPRMEPWRDAATAQGYAATASFPLKAGDRTFGCLTLFASEFNYFEDDEVSLMVAVAENLSFAAESRRQEVAKLVAEADLRASAATMAAAQRIAHFGSWELDLSNTEEVDTNPLRWSDEMYRIAGLQPGSVAATNDLFFSLVPPEEHQLIRDAVAIAIRDRGAYSTVHRLVRPTGEVRIIQETAQVFEQEGGRPLRLVGTAYDITDQRRAEMALLDSKRRLNLILESVGEGIHVLDQSATVVFENPRAVKLLGSVLGRPALQHCQSPTSGKQSGQLALEQTLADGLTRHVEDEVFFRDDGSRLQVAYVCAPLGEEPSGQRGTVVSFRDITRKKRDATLKACEARVLKAISSGQDLESVLTQIAKAIEEVLPEALAAIWLVDPGNARLRLGAAPSLPSGYLQLLADGVPIGEGNGACGTSAYRGQPVMVADISRDPLGIDYREQTEAYGLRACWSWPVKDSDDKVLATFAIYHPRPQTPMPSDLEIADRLSQLVGIAMEKEARETRLRLLATCISRLDDIVLITEGQPIDEPGPRIVFVNPAFEHTTGYTEQEALGRSPRFLQGPKTDRKQLERLREALSRGEGSRTELINYTKSGTQYWVEIDMVPVFSPAGDLTNYVAVQRDVSERKRSEMALRESEERFRSTVSQLSKILESSLDVICSFDAQGRFTQVSRACENVWGYSPDELLGTPFIDLVLPEDREQTERIAASIMAGNPVRSFENRYLRKDGRLAHIQWTAQWSPAEKSTFCVARDITEAKQNAQKLAEQASLLDKAQDAILVRDLEHRVLYWNQSAERLYGWSASEILGRSVEDLLHRGSPEFAAATESLLARGEWNGEIEQFTKSGQVLDVECRWTLVRDRLGQPKSVLAINTDITQRKKLEQQFLRAQRLESLGTLAGGIAHDLNNVLSPILMAIEVLKMEEADDERLDILQVMENSAQRGADMVAQVLSFARGMQGRRTDVQPKHLMLDLVKIVKDTFPKNLEFKVRIEPDLWVLQADPTQLHQVLLNLCVNARDALPAGGTITLSAENTTVDEHYATMNMEARVGPYVKIEVQDTGTGMSKETQEQIFDPFFTTKDVGKGTGLGLSTTLAIVKSHGGFIRVYSEAGVGSKFRVYLPAEHIEKSIEEPLPSVELPRGNGETVLVIDDEVSIRQISKQTLEAFGYRALLASDGPEAVSLYVRHQDEIAAVLCDMMMPVMDGPATIRVLKRLNPEVTVIGASGITTSAMTAEATSAGVVHFLAKPYTAETLLQTLKRTIK
jgi:PAS domain S-box-containing protein